MADDADYGQRLKAFKTMSSAFFAPAIVLTAIDLGVFTGLGDAPLTRAALASKLAVDERALGAILAYLESAGYLERQGEAYANTAFAARALALGSPDYEGDSALLSLGLLRRCAGLADAVRTGAPQLTFEDEISASPRAAQILTRAFDQVLRDARAGIQKHVDMTGVRRVLDVGGASGALACALIDAHDAATATVLELPHAADEARRLIALRGLSDRVSVQGGNFRSDDLGTDWDVVLCSSVLRLLDRASAAALIHKLVAAVAPGGQLVIREMIGAGGTELPPSLAQNAITMLMVSRGGTLHDEASYREWTAAAGLGPLTRIDAWAVSSLLIGRKPGAPAP